MDNVLLFKEISKYDLPKVGFKGLSIATLKHEGFNIPPGFIITSDTFKKFIFETGLKIKIEELLSNLTLDNIEKTSEEIKKLIEETDIPEEIKEEILDSYTSLEFEIGKAKLIDLLGVKEDSLVAVRSSYVEEKKDNSKLSQPTFLSVRGKKDLIKAIKLCWASLYTKDMLLYRQRNKISREISNAVIIQKMIDAEFSGIAYSVNTESKNKSEILIKACFGFYLVPDFITTDKYIVDKKELTSKEYEVNAQEDGFYRDKESGDIIKKSIKNSKVQKLNDRLIREVARLTKKIATLMNKEQMVEYAVYKDDVYILQSKDLKIDSDDELLFENEENHEEKPKIEIVDLYEPDLEEDLAVLEEMELQDLKRVEKQVVIEPKKTDALIKKLEMEQKEDDVLQFIDEVEKRIQESSNEKVNKISKKDIDRDNELLAIELIRTLSDKMERQLREKDFEGYNETKNLLRKAMWKL
jgi:phosphoenolpyruvate synthase/pyruvate phosphate dikinase